MNRGTTDSLGIIRTFIFGNKFYIFVLHPQTRFYNKKFLIVFHLWFSQLYKRIYWKFDSWYVKASNLLISKENIFLSTGSDRVRLLNTSKVGFLQIIMNVHFQSGIYPSGYAAFQFDSLKLQWIVNLQVMAFLFQINGNFTKICKFAELL